MTLDDIKPDVRLILTEEHDRLFKFAGCNPMCHCCSVDLAVGDRYKLATNEDRDVMLCDHCTVADLKERLAEQAAASRAAWLARGGGYSRPTRS